MTTWKPVVGWEQYYEVSDDGQVRSSTDYVSIGYNGARRLYPAGPVATCVAPNGYVNVYLHRDGRRRGAGVHRLMAEAFHGPAPGPWHHARHLDGDRTNNVLANLAWGSPAENAEDTKLHGRQHQMNKTHCPKGHPYSGDNLLLQKGPKGRPHRKCRTCDRARNRRGSKGIAA